MCGLNGGLEGETKRIFQQRGSSAQQICLLGELNGSFVFL